MKYALCLFLVVAGCGGDDVNVGGLSCNTAPCGGDPVGVWTIGATCVTGSPIFEQCPEADIRFAIDQSGTVTVNADMTYESDVTTSGFMRGTIPASCIPTGQITACSDLDSEDTTCTGDIAVECECMQTIDQQDMATGTWEVNGTQITLDGSEVDDFCVDGDAMSVRTTDPTADLQFEILLSR